MEIGVAIGREAKALWRGRRGTSLVAIATGWSLLVGSRMIYPVALPYLQTAFDLSLTVAGLLVSLLWLCGALGQLPGGILADKFDERTILATSPIIVAVAVGVVVVAPSPIVLFLATAVWGLGHSLYPVARITFLSNNYGDRLGSALGVTMAMGDIGQTILPPIAAVVAVSIAWQASLGFVTPLLVLAGILVWAVVPRQTLVDRPDEGRSLRNLRDVLSELRTPSMGFMAVILFLYIFIWQSFTAFYPTYLITVKGLSPSTASVLFGSFFAVGVVVKPLAGAGYDRIGMRASLVAVLAPPVVGFALLPLLDSVWTLAVVTALISTMLGSGAVTQSYLADAFAEETRGTGLGVVRTVTATSGAGGPVAFGAIADHGYFDQGYVALAVIMAAIILLTLRMPRA